MIQLSWLLLTFLAVFFLRSCVQVYLTRLNLSYLRQHGTSVPEIFQDAIDPEKLRKIIAYTFDSENFQKMAALASQAFLLVILLSGFLPWLVTSITQLGYGPIVNGLIFFAVLSIVTGLFRIPFNLYETFGIEERYGFNVMNFRLWILDLLKSMALATLLGGLVLILLLALVVHAGNTWWIWAWLLVGAFELLLLWLFPVAILPLFYKFDPIENKELEERIKTMLDKVGIRARGIFKMDASKRSKHTNAFFIGIGRTKRIVLFDTLLASHTGEEIVAVLAHEAGHWKRKHILRMLIIVELLSLISFYIVAKLLDWPLLYHTFGFGKPYIYVGLFFIGTFFSLLGFFAQPFESAVSRKFEREADDFTLVLMKTAEPMRAALKRLAADNLSNLNPHPLYAWFYYSHPPLAERIERLRPKNDEEIRG